MTRATPEFTPEAELFRISGDSFHQLAAIGREALARIADASPETREKMSALCEHHAEIARVYRQAEQAMRELTRLFGEDGQ